MVKTTAVAIVCALLMAVTAQPVLAWEDRVPATEVDCEDEGPYHKVHGFYRIRHGDGVIYWLRCGTMRWGYEHIEHKHGWGTIPKVATQKTIDRGEKTKQGDKGAFRFNHTFKLNGEKYKWRVVVQTTKTYKGEPKVKGIITSYRRGTIGQG
jgi:hypothetical protein